MVPALVCTFTSLLVLMFYNSEFDKYVFKLSKCSFFSYTFFLDSFLEMPLFQCGLKSPFSYLASLSSVPVKAVQPELSEQQQSQSISMVMRLQADRWPC